MLTCLKNLIGQGYPHSQDTMIPNCRDYSVRSPNPDKPEIKIRKSERIIGLKSVVSCQVSSVIASEANPPKTLIASVDSSLTLLNPPYKLLPILHELYN